MTPQRIQYFYGILDIFVFILFLTYSIINKRWSHASYLTIEILFLPNIILLLVIMFADSFWARYTYQRWLRFKLVIQAFVLPILVLTYDESYWEARVCSRYLDMT